MLITVPSTAAKLNKLNQVTSGFVIDTAATKLNKAKRENGRTDFEPENYFLSDFRHLELDKLLKEKVGDNQAIIWCNFHKEFEIVQAMLGDKCRCAYGKVDITEKNINLKLFKEGKIQYLVANPASCDKGLTLTNAHFAIYFSMNYSYELYKQSIERIYGSIISQPNRCTYYIMMAKGTIDKTIFNTVQTKGDMSAAILEHLKGGK